MNEDTPIKNAVIESVSLGIERGSMLTMSLHLDYGGTMQAFGGYCLYNAGCEPRSQHDEAGFFISRVLEIAGAEDIHDLPGKSIRVKARHVGVDAIGHFLKDKWFNPREEFED